MIHKICLIQGADAMKYESALAQFRSLNQKYPDRVLYTSIAENGKDVSTFTTRQAYDRAEQIAHALINDYSLKSGDRVLLVYPPGLEFVEAFIGCLMAGIIPVPVPPPIPLRPDLGLPGYVSTVTDCQAKAQLTCQSYSVSRTFGRILGILKPSAKWPDLPWIVTDKIQVVSGKRSVPELDPEKNQIAFLQYTSGSTRAPRGVCISFGNLRAQTYLLKTDNLMKWDGGVGVFWMPHYHDFALIGGIISAMCGNYEVVLFSASSFLKRPGLWGEILTRYRATHTGAPDFGYHLLIKKTTPEERAKWDLSSMTVMMNAAEPIRQRTVDALLQELKPARLNPDAFCPSYGLAEHTIAVSVHGKKRFTFKRDTLEKLGQKAHWTRLPAGDPNEVTLFGCGKPCEGVLVRIVDPETLKELPEGHVGEIWVDSENKAKGYFGRPDESAARFEAKLEGHTNTWLRTRDLGVICEGEIVITGRLDDLLTIRGRNIYPQDAEGWVADADPRVRPGRVLAFGIQEQNQVFIVVELKEEKPSEEVMSEVASNARIVLLQEMGLPEAVFIFVPQGTIPKTTSGKLQRNRCRADWLAGKLSHFKVDQGLRPLE
ncbi:MAG: fatty acyl-AMP ligase [Bdellovibrionales bacterium]|nr:fatty acyl-AMP ligase [Bdellovibrionales bacterium]